MSTIALILNYFQELNCQQTSEDTTAVEYSISSSTSVGIDRVPIYNSSDPQLNAALTNTNNHNHTREALSHDASEPDTVSPS